MDNVLGGLYGVFIGDALGAPFEFKNTTPKPTYSGILLDTPITIHFKFTSLRLLPSSITDDSEMTIQLLKSILEGDGYNEERAIKYYLEWANMKSTPLGRNTRALMKGIKTVKGFRNRQAGIDTTNVESNGSLMRCFPLAILPYWRDASDADVSLTNNNDVNRECSRIYLTIARHFIYGDELIFTTTQESIKTAIAAALNNTIIDVSVNKGWVVHALYVALITLFNATSYESGMEFIHRNFFVRTDTDTIMAIAGGLLGAKYGFNEMSNEEKTMANIQKIDTYFGITERISFDTKLGNMLAEFI